MAKRFYGKFYHETNFEFGVNLLNTKYVASFFSKVVVVGVDTAAELRSLNQPLPAHLICLVEGYV